MLEIVAKDVIEPRDDAAIRAALRSYNAEQIGETGRAGEIALLLRDEAGETVGGLTGRFAYGWLFIALLVVPKAGRGQGLGTRLMEQAEGIARDRGLAGIWTDTFAFQAPEFYRKLGYQQFGEIEDDAGHRRHFFVKRLR